jgi:hypothetical protein
VYNYDMATLTIQVPEEIKALAEARAAEAGCADVGEYVARLISGEAAVAPEGLSVESDAMLEALLLRRLDGASVEMDEADFGRMRSALRDRLDPPAGQTR